MAKSRQLFPQKSSTTDVGLGSKYPSIPYMTSLSKIVRQHQEDGHWTSTKKYFKKQHIGKKEDCINKKQQTYLPNTAYLSNQI